jgi:hypothetical protein
MLIEIVCIDCGQLYQPSVEDLRKGPRWYHRCPACRPPTVPEPEP